MIRSFKCKESEKIFQRYQSRKFPGEIQRTALRKLRMMNRAQILNDLKVPYGNRLEKLHGKREGQMSIKMNDQWRICFRWEDRDCYDVEIVDYH
jgi:proteic killer suppression protein